MDGNVICRWSVTLGIALGLSGLSACAGGSHSSTVQRSDSAGIEIVVSSGSDRVLDWQFNRLFELGGAEEGPESFFRVSPRLVRADAAGRIYVLDPESARVVVFDSDGEFIRSMGGRGGGPGEFQSPATMSVSPEGAVAVFDFGKGSLVRFDESGEVEDEQPFPLFPRPDGQRHFEQFHDTTLVSTTHFSSDGNSQQRVLQQIVDSDTLVLAELPLPPATMAMFEKCGGGLRLPPIFAPAIAWDTQPGMVAISLTMEYSISIREDGPLTRIARRAIEPVPASREQAILNLGEGMSIDFGRGPCLIDPAEMVDKRGYADFVPLIGTMFLSPSGELWVERFTADFTADTDSIPPIDVFDAGGSYVGTLVNESFPPVVLLPGERVGIVETDELDVQRLVVLSIQK